MVKYKSTFKKKNNLVKNIEKNFEKNGYVIVPANKKILEEIRNFIFSIIKKNKSLKIDKNYSVDKILNNFHKIIKINKLNNLRFDIYNKINNGKKFHDLYYKLTKEYLDDLVGNEISMQKKINLSIQMPKDKDSLLDLHSDIYAGESPFQVVVWLPLVNAYGTKSMFFTNP